MIVSSWVGELQDGRINGAMFQMSPAILLRLLLMITDIHKTYAGIIIHISSPSLSSPAVSFNQEQFGNLFLQTVLKMSVEAKTAIMKYPSSEIGI